MRHMTFPYGGRDHVHPQANALALHITNLKAGYAGDTPILKTVTLDANVGSRVALIGENGAGKSTLLKTIAGLVSIRYGEVRIYGHPVGACHHRVAYLPQRAEIDWRFPITLERLVMTGRYPHLGWFKRPQAHDRERVAHVIAALGLTSLAKRQISQLSGGQQQRTLLARALAQDADLLLLDEPLNAVDHTTQTVIMRVLKNLKADHKTVMMATHNTTQLSQDFDQVWRIADGCATPVPLAQARPIVTA